MRSKTESHSPGREYFVFQRLTPSEGAALEERLDRGASEEILSVLHEMNALMQTMVATERYDHPMDREIAAEYLGIHPDPLYRWAVEEGRIAYSRLGEGKRAALRFTRRDLDAFVSASRVPTVDGFMEKVQS